MSYRTERPPPPPDPTPRDANAVLEDLALTLDACAEIERTEGREATATAYDSAALKARLKIRHPARS